MFIEALFILAKLESIHTSTNWLMDKQIVVHLYQGTVPHIKKEHPTTWMDLKSILLSDRNQI